MNTIELDIRGQICPSCMLLTLKTLNEHVGQVRAGDASVVVMTDDRQAVNTIPGAVRKMGYRATVEQCEGGYRINVSQP